MIISSVVKYTIKHITCSQTKMIGSCMDLEGHQHYLLLPVAQIEFSGLKLSIVLTKS